MSPRSPDFIVDICGKPASATHMDVSDLTGRVHVLELLHEISDVTA